MSNTKLSETFSWVATWALPGSALGPVIGAQMYFSLGSEAALFLAYTVAFVDAVISCFFLRPLRSDGALAQVVGVPPV